MSVIFIVTFHLTTKRTADYSQETIDFLDLNVGLIGREFMIYLFAKPTNTGQFLDLSFYHPYHCKKDIPYSQSLRLNRICSDSESFDKSCDDLKSCLMKKRCNGKNTKDTNN